MTTEKMTHKQAVSYLVECVADVISCYCDREHDLIVLTGEGIGGKPEPTHVASLIAAFTALGNTAVVAKLRDLVS